MSHIVMFCLFVGIGSTIVLDVWVEIVKKVTGIPPTNWGAVGRWVSRIPKGLLFLDTSDTRDFSSFEKTLGWCFHYIIGVAYAVLLLLLGGVSFIAHPTLMPIFLIGVCLSSLAGLMILMPCLGGGFFARKVPNPFTIIVYIIIAHILFALGQYVFSIMYNVIF
ncbi:DUF2938 family protein [Celerinatantimonas sp. MCCC 1A17872]|uniref:DUF2938 family protein n=1 Tax=Celerinatantimonas sp. MCCC 1A17872 TaxID=3177514 RepID=UPI0038BE2572